MKHPTQASSATCVSACQRKEREKLVSLRDGVAVGMGMGIRGFRRRDEREAVPSLVHFIVWAKQNWDRDFGNGLQRQSIK